MRTAVVIAIATLAYIAGYAIACAMFPLTACPRCGGGRQRSKSGKAWRHCRKCSGTGERPRFGVRLWTWWRNRA